MKKFILGLGAQRAGSTFLFQTLTKSKDSARPLLKEMHIWDALEMEICKKWRIYNPEFLTFPNKALLKKLIKNDEIDNINRALLVKGTRMEFQNNPDRYFDYFNFLLNSQNKEITFDITPEYIGLKDQTLKMIDDRFRKINIDCKFILIIRDPVDRCWSAVKSRRKKSGLNALDQIKYHQLIESVDTETNINESMLKYVKSDDAKFRTNYKKIIEILKKNFDSKKYLVLFYDDILNGTFIQKLRQFLQIDIDNSYIKQKINPSTSEKLDENLIREIAPMFQDIYEYCASEYPVSKDYWRGYKYLQI